MSWNETIDNYLYDEENEYTQADDLWDDFFVEKRDEIDEHPWNQVDALAHRSELKKVAEEMKSVGQKTYPVQPICFFGYNVIIV